MALKNTDKIWIEGLCIGAAIGCLIMLFTGRFSFTGILIIAVVFAAAYYPKALARKAKESVVNSKIINDR